MASKGNNECPLCMEKLDQEELTFYACSCRYQVCRFCWNRIRTEDNGLCPACRKPYSEDPAGFIPVIIEDFQKVKPKSKKKTKQQEAEKKKQEAIDNRKHLEDVRVLKRNLVCIGGLTQKMCDELLLRKPENFGKFGKIKTVITSLAPTGMFKIQGASAYITYARSDDALRAIQATNGAQLDGKTVKVGLGTSKYCANFIKFQPCPKPDCLYMHEMGEPEATFTKDQLYKGMHLEFEKKLHEELALRTMEAEKAAVGVREATPPAVAAAAAAAAAESEYEAYQNWLAAQTHAQVQTQAQAQVQVQAQVQAPPLMSMSVPAPQSAGVVDNEEAYQEVQRLGTRPKVSPDDIIILPGKPKGKKKKGKAVVKLQPTNSVSSVSGNGNRSSGFVTNMDEFPEIVPQSKKSTSPPPPDDSGYVGTPSPVSHDGASHHDNTLEDGSASSGFGSTFSVSSSSHNLHSSASCSVIPNGHGVFNSFSSSSVSNFSSNTSSLSSSPGLGPSSGNADGAHAFVGYVHPRPRAQYLGMAHSGVSGIQGHSDVLDFGDFQKKVLQKSPLASPPSVVPSPEDEVQVQTQQKIAEGVKPSPGPPGFLSGDLLVYNKNVQEIPGKQQVDALRHQLGAKSDDFFGTLLHNSSTQNAFNQSQTHNPNQIRVDMEKQRLLEKLFGPQQSTYTQQPIGDWKSIPDSYFSTDAARLLGNANPNPSPYAFPYTIPNPNPSIAAPSSSSSISPSSPEYPSWLRDLTGGKPSGGNNVNNNLNTSEYHGLPLQKMNGLSLGGGGGGRVSQIHHWNEPQGLEHLASANHRNGMPPGFSEAGDGSYF